MFRTHPTLPTLTAFALTTTLCTHSISFSDNWAEVCLYMYTHPFSPSCPSSRLCSGSVLSGCCCSCFSTTISSPQYDSESLVSTGKSAHRPRSSPSKAVIEQASKVMEVKPCKKRQEVRAWASWWASILSLHELQIIRTFYKIFWSDLLTFWSSDLDKRDDWCRWNRDDHWKACNKSEVETFTWRVRSRRQSTA